MGITCNGPVSLSPMVSSNPIEITPAITNTRVSIRPTQDHPLTPVQVDALNSALSSYKFLPRTTTDKLVEETGVKRHMVEKWFDENIGEEGDAMERWEARSRLLETIEQPDKDTPAKTNRVIQFLDLEDTEEIDDGINDAVEIGEEEEEEEIDDGINDAVEIGGEEEEEEEIDDDEEEEEIELPEEEIDDDEEEEEEIEL